MKNFIFVSASRRIRRRSHNEIASMPRHRLSKISLLLSSLLASCAPYVASPLDAHPPLAAPSKASLASPPVRSFLNRATINLGQPLDANAIASIAVIANPDLKAKRAREQVTQAQAFSAGLLPDPTFSLGADAVLSGPDPLPNLTAALGLDLNALRTHAVTLAQSKAEVRQARLDLAWAEWQTAGQARLLYVRVLGLQTQVRLDLASRDAQTDTLKRTEQAAARGDVDANALQTARQAALSASDTYSATERAFVKARLDLNQILGLPPETTLTLAPASTMAPPLPADRLFAIALDQRMDLAALRAGYDAQEAAVKRAVLNRFPSLNLTVNANRDSSGNMLVGPAVDFTLPIWNRNRGGLAVENATRNALKVEYDARVAQTRADISASVKDIALARQERDRLRASLPQAQAFATATERAARRGDLSPATAEAAAQTLRDAQTQLAKADQDIAELTISLELLTGTPQGHWTP